MVKKIVCFMGSARVGGNTDVLLKELVRGAEEAGAETKTYNLYRLNIKPCNGCRKCKEPEPTLCVIKDDMQEIYQAFNDSDVIVYGSPMYMGYFTTPTVALLHRCYCLRDNPGVDVKGKDFVFLMPYARKDPNFFAPIVDWMNGGWKRMYNGRTHWLLASGLSNKGDATQHPEYLQQAYELGKKLATIAPAPERIQPAPVHAR